MRRIIVIFALLMAVACSHQPSQYVQISGFAQGGNYSVKVNLKGVDDFYVGTSVDYKVRE